MMVSRTSQLTFNLTLVAIRSISTQYITTNINRPFNYIRKKQYAISNAVKKNPFAFTVRKSSCSMSSPAVVLLAEGAEELESVTIIDVLRRGEVELIIAGVCGAEPVKCRSSTRIIPDMSLCQAMNSGNSYSAVILPGGVLGAKILSESPTVGSFLAAQECKNGLIAAICAAPLALKAHKIGLGKCITSYPAMAAELKQFGKFTYVDDAPVVCDCNLITSRGPGTAFIFALTILEKLRGEKVAKEVAAAMLYNY